MANQHVLLTDPDTTLLQHRIQSLTDAMVNRQQIGWVTGLFSGCLGLTAQQSWQLLAKLSQHTNVKAHHVARVIEATRDGEPLTSGDENLAAQLRTILDSAWDQIMAI